KRSSSSGKNSGLGIVSVRNREFLKLPPNEVFAAPTLANGRTLEGKWMRALLNQEALSLFNELECMPNVHRFSHVAEVAVGIVTGAIKCFLVTDEIVERHSLEKWAHPMFGRSAHSPGVIYDDEQHRANAQSGSPTNFLWFTDDKPMREPGPREYI